MRIIGAGGAVLQISIMYDGIYEFATTLQAWCSD